uniref:C-like opsin n=2 Tax=Tripedalia cystophora TaxID=6141 RepID=A0A059NTG7_TRICY|nr:c-like opsin [Tripedalia cystophora]QBS47879.1 lens eye opsin [Tripedalia cystophora]
MAANLSEILSGFLACVVFLSISLNLVVLITFYRLRQKLSFKDALMASMALSDVVQAIIGYPLEVFTVVDGQWTFGMELCQVAAFFITALGQVSIAHLTALALDRYFTVCRPFVATAIHGSMRNAGLVIFFCWFYASFWAVLPLVGWSNYDVEGDGMRCSINWADDSPKSYSYRVCLFVFLYLIPVLIMGITYILVQGEMKNMRGRAAQLFGSESEAALKNIKAEKRHTRLVFVMILSFVVAWTPYTFVAMWVSFFTKQLGPIPLYVDTLAAMLAKSSAMFNPIIYCFLHKQFRRAVLRGVCGRIVGGNAIAPSSTGVEPGQTLGGGAAES